MRPADIRATGADGRQDGSRDRDMAGTWKERALDDFRRWLDELEEIPPAGAEQEPPSCDLHDLFAELAALRQEVRLQNREQSRAGRELANAAASYDAIDRTTRRRDEELAALERRVSRAAEDRCLLSVLDLRDALVRGREAARKLRKAGKKARRKKALQRKPFRRLRPAISGVVDGYELALRRCDRTLAQYDVHGVPALGLRFDARTMHAVETRRVADREDGVVVDEFVGGFVRDGEVLRLAEVAVNRVQGAE
ncbi:MAG: nucleotide exchange factor GrpE [Spirochaetaceae bacterium]|nr:nucleotide exchange factor GrpE [Spirochaetaceae bacterium]